MKVVITGGAGFLGRAILRERPWQADYIVLSRDETKHEELRRRHPDVRTVLGDVRDGKVLTPLFAGADIVVHAAAVKYVDDAERNVGETVSTNIAGTWAVLQAAARAGVPQVVTLSTDKATAPLNTYGATKQLGERLVGEYADRWANTRFVACRYGNVVGSTGSVTWKWAKAIEAGLPVAMTDPAMTRFWMSPSQAVQVVVAACAAPTGTVTIPFCAAMRMGDVAEALGARRIDRIGLRPGERMNEMLVSAEESPRAVRAGDVCHLRPAYEVGRRGEPWSYTSDKPARWLAADEMREYLEEARALW